MKKEIKQFLTDKLTEKWIKENPLKTAKIKKAISNYMIWGKPILFKKNKRSHKK